MGEARPKHVLVVDDQELFLSTVSDGFAAHRDRVRVTTARNGLEALAELRKAPVDLLVTDLKMPELDGFGLLSQMSVEFPGVPVVVMTAFSTPEIAEKLTGLSVLSWLDKPIDFPALARRVFDTLDAAVVGSVQGITLPSFLQVIQMERKTCALQVRSGALQGVLCFDKGELVHADGDGTRGNEAALAMVGWEPAEIRFVATVMRPPRSVDLPLAEIIMDGLRLKDERGRGARSGPAPPAVDMDAVFAGMEDLEPVDEHNKQARNNQENPMANNDKLQQLSNLEGFSGAAVFTPAGEELASVSGGAANFREAGVLANAVLLNAQKACLEMGAGRGQLVHVEGEKAHVLARCVNEGTDPLKSQPGKAHVHVVLIVKPDAAIGLAKMKLNAAAEAIAPDFRG